MGEAEADAVANPLPANLPRRAKLFQVGLVEGAIQKDFIRRIILLKQSWPSFPQVGLGKLAKEPAGFDVVRSITKQRRRRILLRGKHMGGGCPCPRRLSGRWVVGLGSVGWSATTRPARPAARTGQSRGKRLGGENV